MEFRNHKSHMSLLHLTSQCQSLSLSMNLRLSLNLLFGKGAIDARHIVNSWGLITLTSPPEHHALLFFPLCVLQINVPLSIYTFSLEVCFQITLLIREFTWHLMFYSCLMWAYHFCCIYLKGIVVNITYSKTREFVNFD